VASNDLPARRDEDGLFAPKALDRRAVERVLARAAELQGIGSSSDADAITEERLLEIAKEAGLTTTAVRQALAEERSRLDTGDEEQGWLTRVTGPAVVTASRTVLGTPDIVMASLEVWMERQEGLIVQRRFPDRILWESRTDIVHQIRRSLRLGRRTYQLSRARQVAATIVPVDEHHSLVRLDADLGNSRSISVRAGSAVGASGLIAGGSTIAVGTMVHVAAGIMLFGAAVPIAAAGAGAYLIMRRHHGVADRTLLALEQVLDALEYGAPRPTSFLDALTMPRPLVR
jgi:hypothetical protein